MTAPQRLTDRKREAIVAAAIAEFRDNGFEVTSMDKIAATAGVSKRTVYNHFPSKEELFTEILNKLWASSVAQLDVSYSSAQPLRDQLRVLLHAKMKMMSDANFLDLARVAIAATIHSPERAQGIVNRLSEREEGFTLWVRAAQEDGRLKAVDPCFAAHQVQSLLKAFAFWPQITLGQPTLDAATQANVIESAMDLFLAGYEIATRPQ
ncbi:MULTISPECIES: TetR/AcrR family transcriptional regulator [unclassified Pseudomonas]|jgi:TetR/AcrR family transcriptional regulator, regulator of autoinduction and epiphytic fitness|uniref:TetR/AcrR family transcriptional regulator n=1 Tax=Pseudomonas TaxID=286 RepID=UPI00071710E7|nr:MULTISPECIES: TetR/AcrR family transcriptional regulator [unclassified Pseudomonas]MDZ4301619.1 TetR/AcrR family transcriptional regulator [Pseudomonas sp.]OAE14682.1 TetR family transcriptional regulator [Pseudomonas brenneri]MBJ2251179.1 TetR/AcrR family transcriptional regulator [Pseudomonas sp. MF6784]MBJ2264791.1 TetR/AcrR family transcriptional regulator [Pseudomonas sp. MF6787]MBJ2290373.1 TetR/AcrR family transcriptional regulator [Pseudomonas sp. MF5691]